MKRKQMKTAEQPWIVIFPDNLANSRVYVTEEAARAMVERTRDETAGNVDAVAMPLDVAASAPQTIHELRADLADARRRKGTT